MNTRYLKQFERYYNHEMEPDEKASFEDTLSKDSEFKASYEEYLSIYDAIADQEMLDLRIKLREIREENERKNSGKDFLGTGYNWLWMAALITITVSFTVILSLMITRPDHNTYYSQELENVDVQKYSGLDTELRRFGQRNVGFKIEIPADQVFFHRSDPLWFKWTADTICPVILEFLDWEGEIVYSSKQPVSSPYYVKKKLPSGMLVYRFRTETESYYLGLMFMK